MRTTFTPAGLPFPLHLGYWKGTHVGIYRYNIHPEVTRNGLVQADYFHYNIRE